MFNVLYQRPDDQTRCVILSDPLRQRLRGGSLRMTGQAIGPLVLEQLSAIKRGTSSLHLIAGCSRDGSVGITF